MELNKTTQRLIAARRPFSVVEIKNDPRITKQNGKQSSYNIVGNNGSGIAEFGCDELAAIWFCEAANLYANEIYSRHSTVDEVLKAWDDYLEKHPELPPSCKTSGSIIPWLLAHATEEEGGKDGNE